MSLFSNLRTSSSGLLVASTSMSVIGDNIANVNTIGFKRGHASFADSFPVDVSYVHGPISIGTGAYVGNTNSEFSQGAIQISNNNLHLAISGNGFFTVNDHTNDGTFYTRNGEFYLNNDGYIVSPGGLRLQGYKAIDGALQPSIGDLQVNMGDITAQSTSEVTLTANLDADADSTTTPLASMSLNGSTETIAEVAAASDFSTSVSVYDTLGDKHEFTLAYEKTGTNTWTCYVVTDGGDIYDQSSGATLDSGQAFKIASIDLTFDTDGSLINFAQTNVSATSPWNFLGAADMDFTFNFGLDASGNAADGAVTQFSSNSTVTSIDQDGYGVGHLTSLQVETDGTVKGVYDNGQDITIGQVVIASFDSTSGLERMGGNLFRATRIPGEPSYGVANQGGRGDIFGSSLEASNVDIEDEFVSMITAQRSYQANSRVMSATNELLRELVNLV
ncbi:MAG: flagellar hook protein FlgE [Myxococcota bacterium]|nr:flagellar hook protein FlgE [Myxococcota bacterium]